MLFRSLIHGRFLAIERQGKYILLTLAAPGRSEPVRILAHLGMTGRLRLKPAREPFAQHDRVALHLGDDRLVMEDPRCFGRFTLDLSPLDHLGMEPLAAGFTIETFSAGLRSSRQAIKVRLLDQSFVAGIGNIYASEALFRARIHPRRSARRLSRDQCQRLHEAIREVLTRAIDHGRVKMLMDPGGTDIAGIFYHGNGSKAPAVPAESGDEFMVYDREGGPCSVCGAPIRRIVQSMRSTYFCGVCQP